MPGAIQGAIQTLVRINTSEQSSIALSIIEGKLIQLGLSPQNVRNEFFSSANFDNRIGVF